MNEPGVTQRAETAAAGGPSSAGAREVLRAVVGVVLILGVVFGLLRFLHLALPVFYPKVLSGPFALDGLEQVEGYTGFSPRVPFYRPRELGERPVHVTVTRRPRPRVVVFWQGEHFLYLSQEKDAGGRRAPAGRVPVTARPLPEHPEARWWRDGATHHVRLPLDDLVIELRTDLDLRDVERLVSTLRPYDELL